MDLGASLRVHSHSRRLSAKKTLTAFLLVFFARVFLTFYLPFLDRFSYRFFWFPAPFFYRFLPSVHRFFTVLLDMPCWWAMYKLVGSTWAGPGIPFFCRFPLGLHRFLTVSGPFFYRFQLPFLLISASASGTEKNEKKPCERFFLH